MAKETIKDLENQVIEDGIDALPPVQMMPEREEQDPLILVDRRINSVTYGGVIIAGINMNPGKNKSLRCWLIVTASAMFLTNYIYPAAPKFQLSPLEPMVIFTMFMCAILLVFRTIKEM
ncbi:hypothetical protein BDA96_10G292300 [Sorghum bicolor]|uniref:Uncharacterized protein n=2 Tax=Sorghum bicolor TaxID=4558 RepID=A0A194YKY0_SORBI|nr:uncharacterized protein LOC110430860 [Sorghum bicolor]KAG0515599.1 hypothetical protein BDA96_10G292300 [Sorghum bicolor]KXG20602.1 hypothetical protein SORBI_3010G225600 [Sorghum bicolor]|eukprot:XP_021304648.1 uncharacterized protein LOC110430860 [Sorghum bicolor]